MSLSQNFMLIFVTSHSVKRTYHSTCPAISTVFGAAGPVYITVAMVLFAFTTLIGNLYYVDNALIYLHGKKEPSKAFMRVFHAFCALVVLAGAMIPMDAAWAVADILMGGMTFINLPVCVVLGNVAIKTLDDYVRQRREGKDPVFRAKSIGLDETDLDFWRSQPVYSSPRLF